MARTGIQTHQIKDSTIQRADIDVHTPGEALITRLIAGDNVVITSSGADTGTGDVTIHAQAGITVTFIPINPNGQNVNYQLPDPTTVIDLYIIKKITSESTYKITLTSAGNALIDGQTQFAFKTAYSAVMLKPYNSAWYII